MCVYIIFSLLYTILNIFDLHSAIFSDFFFPITCPAENYFPQMNGKISATLQPLN